MTARSLATALLLTSLLAGCNGMPYIIGAPLTDMAPRNVCREMGRTRYEGDMEGFSRARSEADKRIASGAISAKDCEEFAQWSYLHTANRSSGELIGH